MHDRAGPCDYLLAPRVTTVIPSPLICIVVLTAVSVAFPMPLRTIADLGRLPDATARLCAARGADRMAHARHRRALCTGDGGGRPARIADDARVVDDLTESGSDKAREATGLGLANVAAGLFGGIAPAAA